MNPLVQAVCRPYLFIYGVVLYRRPLRCFRFIVWSTFVLFTFIFVVYTYPVILSIQINLFSRPSLFSARIAMSSAHLNESILLPFNVTPVLDSFLNFHVVQRCNSYRLCRISSIGPVYLHSQFKRGGKNFPLLERKF